MFKKSNLPEPLALPGIETEIFGLMRAEIEALRGEMQADRHEFQAARIRFELEMDAMRAELQAERNSFLSALEELKFQHRQLAAQYSALIMHPQQIDHVVNSIDGALAALVHSQARQSD